jgi:GNAT superfamily N-acetyltransferase
MDSLLPDFPGEDNPYHFSELAPEAMGATWGALRQHELRWSPNADLDALLKRWELTGAGDPETAAVVTVPSRATEAAAVLVRHGFAPLLVVAARKAGRVGPPAPEVRIRPLEASDVDFAVDLNVETVHYDAQFGVVTSRESSAENLRREITGLLARDVECAWLAEQDGEAVGLLYVDLPPHSDWMRGRTSVSPMAYLAQLGVRAKVRGAGIGSALANHAHRRLDDAGIALTLLHHALPNPRSTPFWYSHGYRPLWTTWQRRPAL